MTRILSGHVLSLDFNQDLSCICLGTRSGIVLFNLEPFGRLPFTFPALAASSSLPTPPATGPHPTHPAHTLALTGSGAGSGLPIHLAQILFTTSILAYVPAHATPADPAGSPRRCTILNRHRPSRIADLLCPDTVLAIRLNRSRLVLALADRLLIHDLATLARLHTIHLTPPAEPPTPLSTTTPPADPRHALSQTFLAMTSFDEPPNTILAYPTCLQSAPSFGPSTDPSPTPSPSSSPAPTGMKDDPLNTYTAQVGPRRDIVLFDATTLRIRNTIQCAHRTDIAILALSADASLIASASFQGTVVRVWCTATSERRWQFRRGSTPQLIHSLAFDPLSRILALSSASNTIHLFRLQQAKGKQAAQSTTTTSSPPDSPSSVPDAELDVPDHLDSEGSSTSPLPPALQSGDAKPSTSSPSSDIKKR